MFFYRKITLSAVVSVAAFGSGIVFNTTALAADTVFTDDVIISLGGVPVRPGICIGGGCTAESEDLTQNKIRLKESVLRVHFVDTTTQFPGSSTDWRLLINGSAEGASNFFAIQDIDSDTIPFRVDAGALDDALRIDSSSRIGLGTATPDANLHIKDGDTPDIMFEQDGSGGFTPQIWAIGGNHTGFGISDITGGDTIPVGIEPGAPTDSLRITSSGQLGLGAPIPQAGLHVKRTDGTGSILIEETGAGTLGQLILRNNGITFFRLEDTSIVAGNNTGRAWNFQNQAGTFRVTTAPGGPGEIEMILTPAGDLTIKGDLFTTGSVCSAGCDRVFDADYELPTIAEQSELMRTARHLPNVGPTPANGAFNVTQKIGGMLNELEKAHIYIEQLYHENKAMKQKLAAQEVETEKLNTRLARLEQLLDQ